MFKKVKLFLNITVNSLQKHFVKWLDSPLFFFAFFTEAPIGRAVAQFLLGRPYNGPTTFVSAEHKTTIDLEAFYSFLQSKCSNKNVQNVLEKVMVKEGEAELILIANGLDMWDAGQENTSLGNFRKQFKRKYGGQGSNAQLSERGVKDSATVTLGKRDES